MSLEGAIYTLLAADGTVSGIVSTRIHNIYLPEGVSIPAIVFSQISGVPDYSCDGATGQRASRYQITSWARTPVLARTLAAAVDSVFSGYFGTSDSTVFQAAFVGTIYDIPSLSVAEQQDRYGKAVDVTFHTAD